MPAELVGADDDRRLRHDIGQQHGEGRARGGNHERDADGAPLGLHIDLGVVGGFASEDEEDDEDE